MSHPILKKDRYSRRRALKAIIILPSFKRMLLQGSWLQGGMPQWLAIYQHVALQILEYNWMLPGFVSGFWNKGKKGGTIQMPSKPKWSFSFIGKKMKKSATLKLLAFCDFTAYHQIFKVQYFRQWQYSQSVCQRASKFRTESRKIDPQVGNEPSLRGLQMGHWPKLVVWQKSDFFGKNWDFGPKKSVHFLVETMFWHRQEKCCSKKKVAFAQIRTPSIVKGNKSLRIKSFGLV